MRLILIILIQSSQLIGQSSDEKTSSVIESSNLIGKTISFSNEANYNYLISVIFKENYGATKKTGIAKFPSDKFSDYPEIAVLLEKNFIINDTISDYYFIAKNGISDRVVIKLNDVLLQNTNNQKDFKEVGESSYYTGRFSEFVIPKSIIINGVNTLQIFVLKTTSTPIFHGDIYLKKNDSELKDLESKEINLNGDWTYTVYSENLSNFKTGGLDANVTSVFPNYDFNVEKFASSSFDDNDWSTTDFPNSFALIFSRQQIDGAVWFRKKINFTEKPKEDYLFEVLDGIDDVDFLYVNGQLVGSTNCYNCPRRYKIPKEYMQKENIFTLLIIDNYGLGGLSGPIKIKTSKQSIDISKGWKFKLIFDIKKIHFIEIYKEISNPFESNNYSFIDFNGNAIQKLKVAEMMGIKIGKDYETPFYLLLLITLILIIVSAIFIYRNFTYKLNKKEDQTNFSSNDNTLSSRILIRSGRTDHNIEINSISLVEAKKDYVKISTTDNSYLVRNNLKVFLEQLPENILIRINKSQAININQIDRIKKNIIYTKNDISFKIGKSYTKTVNQLLK
ncbi:LytTR family transcriptional regulator DNA-binding domain-containing protein [Flavobacteriaceae bacterium]|nr:LytTR family transcriptional regulator DNA-binding domain-containing protein [Flavobacteriaceae bacterium]